MWPDGARCAASFTFDFDAEEVWIGEDPENAHRPGVLSQGTYGAKVAVPQLLALLERRGVRATFFVSTSFISERRIYWWERIALLISRTRRATATLRYPGPLTLELGDPTVGDKLNSLIKDTRGLDVERFLGELAEALGVEWNAPLETRYADDLIMTWDQVRALARAGMDVESHGRRHRVLQTLDDGELEDELTGARLDLEAQLGRPVRAVAYPVGRRVARVQRIRRAVQAAGYQIGMSNSSGVNRWWPPALRRVAPIDRFDIRRLSTDRAMSDAMFLTQVVVPRFAYISEHNR